jgi:hypothetical protein
MDPLTLGLAAAALLLFAGKKAAAAKKPAAPRGVVTLGPVTGVKAKPASAPTVTQSNTITAPLSEPPSQGGGAPLAASLSADIATDVLTSPAAPRADTTPRSQPSGYNPTAARRGAPSIANHLKRAGKAKYDHRLLRQWQTQSGLKPDGLYGPASRGALLFFGVKDPPQPFSGTGTTPYQPPV